MKKVGQILCIECRRLFDEKGNAIKSVDNEPIESKSSEKPIKLSPDKKRSKEKPTIVQQDISVSALPNKLTGQNKQDEDCLENVNAIKRIYTAVLLEEVTEISIRESLSNRDKMAFMRSLIEEAKILDLL